MMDFRNSWRIRSHINSVEQPSVKVVYRYMKQKHIDNFFRDGTLKLSSFSSNGGELTPEGISVNERLYGVKAPIRNNIRNDSREGTHKWIIFSRDRKTKIVRGVEELFDTTRMLCASKKLDLEFYCNRFAVDGCLRITNTLGFGYEVSKVLKGYSTGLEGMVEYSDRDYSVLFLENHPELPDLKSEQPPMEDFQKYLHVIGELSLGQFFLKPQIFQLEDEYRFSWKCASNHDYIIKCPEASKYCEQVKV
jgi:hypothetical protein